MSKKSRINNQRWRSKQKNKQWTPRKMSMKRPNLLLPQNELNVGLDKCLKISNLITKEIKKGNKQKVKGLTTLLLACLGASILKPHGNVYSNANTHHLQKIQTGVRLPIISGKPLGTNPDYMKEPVQKKPKKKTKTKNSSSHAPNRRSKAQRGNLPNQIKNQIRKLNEQRNEKTRQELNSYFKQQHL